MKPCLPVIAATAVWLAAALPAQAGERPATAGIAGEPELVQVLDRHGFDGEIAVTGGSYDGFRSGAGQVWPLASISKQFVATLVMQQVEKGELDLDAPVSAYLESWPGSGPQAPSLRQLLRHQSGLYDPEDDPEFDRTGAFPLDPMMCVARRDRAPGGEFDYTNCDTLLVGKVLESVTGRTLDKLLSDEIAGPLGLESLGFAQANSKVAPSLNGTPVREIAAYGASGGMIATATDLLAFDRALMEGGLLGSDALAEMWAGDPALGYTALGQWEFSAPLSGCADPVRIVERRGAIGGYQARNFIVPERGVAVAVFIGKGEDVYPFGEIWTGSGLSHDILSRTVCP